MLGVVWDEQVFNAQLPLDVVCDYPEVQVATVARPWFSLLSDTL